MPIGQLRSDPALVAVKYRLLAFGLKREGSLRCPLSQATTLRKSQRTHIPCALGHQ